MKLVNAVVKREVLILSVRRSKKWSITIWAVVKNEVLILGIRSSKKRERDCLK